MDVKYKAYTEVLLYLHDAEDYYSQLENFEDPDIVSLDEEFFENAAMCEEEAMEEFLEQDMLSDETMIRMIKNRNIFPKMISLPHHHIL